VLHLFASLSLALAAAPSDLSRGLVASGQGYFPVAQRLADGRIAVVFRGGAPHLGVGGRLDIAFSADDGKTWTKPTVVVDSPADDRNPAFGQAADGTLVVGFWRTTTYDEQGRYDSALPGKPRTTWVTRSADGGKTWDQPVEIDIRDIGYGSPYGKIVATPGGALLMPVYGHGPAGAAGEWSYLYRSTDAGRTWVRFATVGQEKFNETAVVRLRSGRLVAALRGVRPADGVFLAESRDDGKTWSDPQPLAPAAHHPADLLELPDGRVLLTVGRRVPPRGVVGLVGDADGRFDWAARFPLIDDATSTDCGYPSSVLLPGGRAATFYYAVGRSGDPGWGVHCGAVTYKVP
jgi:hypothetical protein